MRRRLGWNIIGLCVLGSMGAAVACWANSTLTDALSGQPRVVIHCTLQDLGTINQGELALARFPISNTGSRRLIVTEQTNLCCGDTPETRTIVVAPGKTQVLNTEINTRLWCGQMSHTTRYTTNDPKRPQFIVTVRATVISDSEVEHASSSAEGAFKQPREASHP